MEKIWKDVVGYEGLYKVSNCGEIISCKRVVHQKWTRFNNSGERTVVFKEKQLPGWKMQGYLFVKLYKSGEKPKTVAIHALVLTAFVGPCPENMECCHGNGIRDDNRLENLRWGTVQTNMDDRAKHGNHWTEKGSQRYNAKLTEDQVREMRAKFATGETSYTKLANEYGISYPTVAGIITNRAWKHVE